MAVHDAETFFVVKRSEAKANLESSIGTLLTQVQDGRVEEAHEFGRFRCTVEDYDDFSIVRRDFETDGTALSIPFSSQDLSLLMMFSMNGSSAFNNRLDPFLLSPFSHSLCFFEYYQCKNLLGEKSHQHDVTIRLKKDFYFNLLSGNLHTGDRLADMVLRQKQFNTINEHIPTDIAIQGILQNIVSCPFEGDMKIAFVREHIRALLMLQLFHFNATVFGKELRIDTRISKRDEDILQDVKEYLDQNFLDPSSLDILSKQFGLNEFKLKHGFKVLFDTSPIRYLQQKRLTFSLFLLKETDKTIKEIADHIGYSHAANYTIAFTKAFGSSPLNYRSSGKMAVRS